MAGVAVGESGEGIKRCYYRVSEMVVLALDSTARRGSCAVLRDDVVLGVRVSDPGVSAASQLPGELRTLLAEASLGLDEVDVFAVAVGPGSFTGLRVGIACMQGLAFARRRPLVGVSALDALACIGVGSARPLPSSLAGPSAPARLDVPRRTATWVDAWRGDVFAALYEDGVLVEGPTVESPAQVLDRVATAPTLFIGDGVPPFVDLIQARCGAGGVIATEVAPALAVTIAFLAAEVVRAGQRPPPDAIRPLYVRRPDVERASAVRR
jgi:tRNA threonylcarbamoyladenosine biosynthesis protein TsaB